MKSDNENEDALLKMAQKKFHRFVLFSFLFLGLVAIGNIGCNRASETCVWNDAKWDNCNWQ